MSTPSIKVKNVPKGFSFPISKKQLRAIVAPLSSVFEEIKMEAISMSEDKKSLNLGSWHVGILSASRDDADWSFSLEINALRNENLVAEEDKIASMISSDITSWVEKKMTLPNTAPEEPTKLFLGFRSETTGLVTNSFEVTSR